MFYLWGEKKVTEEIGAVISRNKGKRKERKGKKNGCEISDMRINENVTPTKKKVTALLLVLLLVLLLLAARHNPDLPSTREKFYREKKKYNLAHSGPRGRTLPSHTLSHRTLMFFALFL
jgi:hypothetical protein